MSKYLLQVTQIELFGLRKYPIGLCEFETEALRDAAIEEVPHETAAGTPGRAGYEWRLEILEPGMTLGVKLISQASAEELLGRSVESARESALG